MNVWARGPDLFDLREWIIAVNLTRVHYRRLGNTVRVNPKADAMLRSEILRLDPTGKTVCGSRLDDS